MPVFRTPQYRRPPIQKGPKDLDFLLEIPNLGLADGYGQAARSIVLFLQDICKEEGWSMGIVDFRVGCVPIERPQEYEVMRPIIINRKDIGRVKVFMRFSLPQVERYNAKKAIAMTMFETDIVPPAWVEPLDTHDLVITPTEWGVSVFQKHIKPRVIDIPLPVNQLYYAPRSKEALTNRLGSKFRFITVGNYFQPDRKRLVNLINTFSTMFKGENCELYVKSSWMDPGSNSIDISKLARPMPNVNVNLSNIATEELIKLYLSSHCAVFPSMGEGYGMPIAEAALLGRPLVLADNSAMSTMATKSESKLVKCISCPADYTPQLIDQPGRWGLCDMEEFLATAREYYEMWSKDKAAYSNMVEGIHKNTELRVWASHKAIKERFRSMLLDIFSEIN
jgi:glycosyltransferase involved in cell wall biosynthesis